MGCESDAGGSFTINNLIFKYSVLYFSSESLHKNPQKTLLKSVMIQILVQPCGDFVIFKWTMAFLSLGFSCVDRNLNIPPGDLDLSRLSPIQFKGHLFKSVLVVFEKF